jgi:hypothetical protein
MQDRKMVLYTDEAGFLQFNRLLDEANLIGIVEFLHERNEIEDQEKTRLIQMIKSPDEDDTTIVKLILSTQHGYTFFAPGT